MVDLNDYDPNTVTSLLKLYLRELPEPLIPLRLMPRFEAATRKNMYSIIINCVLHKYSIIINCVLRKYSIIINCVLHRYSIIINCVLHKYSIIINCVLHT